MDAKLQKALVTALHKLFKPLVQILIRNGISFPMAAEVLKRCYLNVAADDFREPGGRKMSAARLSLLTGMHRKDIARLRSLPDPTIDRRWEAQNHLAQLVLMWANDAAYCLPNGSPRELPIEGPAPSFESLVVACTGDVPVVTTLEELVRIGTVERINESTVKLKSRVYYPAQNEREKLWVLGNAGADLYDTIGHNLQHAGKASRYQSYVYFDNLPDEVLAQIRERANQSADRFMKETLEWLKAYDRDENPTVGGGGRNRAGVGVYYFEHPVKPTDDAV
jgi:hypothetical protein